MRIITSWRQAMQWAGVLVVCVGVAGCSGESSSGGGTPQVTHGATTTGTVTAAAGGTITITDPTSPIAGASVTVPAGAIDAGSMQISITHQDALPGPLHPNAIAAGAQVVSKTIVLTKDRPSSFNRPVEVTIPYAAATLDVMDVPTVLYWDERSHLYEAATVTGFDPAGGTITFQTVHFSTWVTVVIPGLGRSLRTDPAANLLSTTTGIAAIGARPPRYELPPVDTNFRPSIDGFSIQNFESYSSPLGNCEGLASYAQWYYNRNTNPPPTLVPLGLHVFGKYSYPNFDKKAVFLKELLVQAQRLKDHTVELDLILNVVQHPEIQAAQASNLLTLMMTTGHPQLFLMGLVKNTGPNTYVAPWGHALVAYRYSKEDQTFYLYDPNIPCPANGCETLGVKYNASTGNFSGLTSPYKHLWNKLGQPNAFAVGSSALYDPAKMENLFNTEPQGWDFGTSGQILVNNPTIDAFTNTATVTDLTAVHLAGTVLINSVPNSALPAPNQMAVYINGTNLPTPGFFTIINNTFDIPLPDLTQYDRPIEILMVASLENTHQGIFDRKSTPANSGTVTPAYGTLRRIRITVSTVQFSSPTYSVVQTAGTSLITVTRTGDSSGTATVQYATSDGTDGTGVAGQDYTATSGSLTFNPTETSKTFTIPILNNLASQGDRTVNLALSQPSSGIALGAQITAVLTITKAPQPPPVNFIKITSASCEVPQPDIAIITINGTARGVPGVVPVAYADSILGDPTLSIFPNVTLTVSEQCTGWGGFAEDSSQNQHCKRSVLRHLKSYPGTRRCAICQSYPPRPHGADPRREHGDRRHGATVEVRVSARDVATVSAGRTKAALGLAG